MSYAQNKEDLFVLGYFKGYVGTLLEIGANDGVTLSNSKLLIEKGWKAHLVEPSSVHDELSKLYKGNPDVMTYKIGIHDIDKDMVLHESGAHVPNGKDKALVSTVIHSEKVRWGNVEFREITVPFVKFKTFLKFAGIETFDFISIDAEGCDWLILQQINLEEVGCKCLCIEHNGDPELIKNYTKYCAQFGLTPILRNAENLIFALNETLGQVA